MFELLQHLTLESIDFNRMNTFLPQGSPLQFIHMSHSRHFPRITLNTPMMWENLWTGLLISMGMMSIPPKQKIGQEVCCFQEISDSIKLEDLIFLATYFLGSVGIWSHSIFWWIGIFLLHKKQLQGSKSRPWTFSMSNWNCLTMPVPKMFDFSRMPTSFMTVLWWQSQMATEVISLQPRNFLVFAWVFGDNYAHGPSTRSR